MIYLQQAIFNLWDAKCNGLLPLLSHYEKLKVVFFFKYFSTFNSPQNAVLCTAVYPIIFFNFTLQFTVFCKYFTIYKLPLAQAAINGVNPWIKIKYI